MLEINTKDDVEAAAAVVVVGNDHHGHLLGNNLIVRSLLINCLIIKIRFFLKCTKDCSITIVIIKRF